MFYSGSIFIAALENLKSKPSARFSMLSLCLTVPAGAHPPAVGFSPSESPCGIKGYAAYDSKSILETRMNVFIR